MKKIHNFNQFLNFYCKKYNEKNYYIGKNVILTFDDGFYSNILLERNILKKLKIKAIYFIPTNFILMKKKSQCIKFIKNRLKLKNYNNLSLKRINMNLGDIIELDKKKHAIGNHTKSHLDFQNCHKENER